MNYPRSESYHTPAILSRIMGPNPIKLTEELLDGNPIPAGANVLDLGSGQGVTSLFLAKEYGFRVYAADLWSDPTDNMAFFEQMGLSSSQILPLHADANELPFPRNFFDAVASIDSYNYFGRSADYLEKKLLPFVKPGGLIYIVVPGMKQDCHKQLPAELLLSWTPEQLEYLHDIPYWRSLLEGTANARILSIREMESNEQVWQDWLQCDNDYARGDRKAIEAGGCRYLNFISIVLTRTR